MNIDDKIIDCIYKLIIGSLEINEFNSFNKFEKNLFIETIFKSRAHFLIYKLLNKHEDTYKKYNFYKKAKEIVNFSTLQTLIHREESIALNQLLKNNKIKFVFLKGMHLINSYYDDLIERPVRDIDILVEKKDIKKIVHILKNNGYKFEFDVDEASLDYFLTNSYDIPLLIGKNKSRLEVHFAIESESQNTKCIFSERFLKDAKITKLGDCDIPVLSSEDLILHLIYHGFKKSGPNVGTIFISDIFKVLSSYTYDLSILIEKAKLYNLTPHLKIIVELLSTKSIETRIHSLNKKIDFKVDPILIKNSEFLFIRNDILDDEVKLLKLIKKFQLKRIISNYNPLSLQREYNINKTQYIKILFSYFLRMMRHFKILIFFTLRIIFFRSIRLQFYKIKNILMYINDF